MVLSVIQPGFSAVTPCQIIPQEKTSLRCSGSSSLLPQVSRPPPLYCFLQIPMLHCTVVLHIFCGLWACVGVMAGFNMSSDLQRPENNIPVGTLAAVFTSYDGTPNPPQHTHNRARYKSTTLTHNILHLSYTFIYNIVV